MELPLIDAGRSRPWKLYLLLLLVAVLAAVFLRWAAGSANSAQPPAAEGKSASDSLAAVDAVNAFALFAAKRRAEREAGKDHEYTAEGMRLLGAALFMITKRESIAPSRYANISEDLIDAAFAIEQDPNAITHADVVRATFSSASAALADVQRARYPQLASAVNDLREAAKALRADRPLLQQTETIQRFFDRASDALRGMAEVGL